MAATQELDARVNELDKVFAWRYEELLRAGCDDPLAAEVASSGFDLHRALAMLEQGCPHHLLRRIAS